MRKYWVSQSKVRGTDGRRRRSKDCKCPLLDVILSVFLVCLCFGISTAACLSKSCGTDPEGRDQPPQLETNGEPGPRVGAEKLNRGNPSNNSADSSAGQGDNSSFVITQGSAAEKEDPVVSLKLASTNYTATPSRSTDSRDESSGGLESAAVSIVIPFVAIIVVAVALVVMYKLTNKYHCCFSRDRLQKWSNFCDSCNPNPQQYVYQVPPDQNVEHALRTSPPGVTRAALTSQPQKKSRA